MDRDFRKETKNKNQKITHRNTNKVLNLDPLLLVVTRLERDWKVEKNNKSLRQV